MAYFGNRLTAALASTAFFLAPAVSFAQEQWVATRVESASFPAEILEERREAAPQGLPDGLMETHPGPGDIVAAWYASPTERYGHGVIGDAIEAASLVVETSSGQVLALDLPETEVFEDRYLRLADLDEDGTIEVITIRSSVTLGASVTVYGLQNKTLQEKASTPFIGRSHRWLNIAGLGRFRGMDGKEIAFVRTPHIGGTLWLYAYSGGALDPAGRLEGFSNHRMGSRELRLSVVADLDADGRDELALPSDDRTTLRIVGFRDESLVELAAIDLPARIDKAITLEGEEENARIVVGLENSYVYIIHQ